MKGQVTIEFILVLVVMLVILATVSFPLVDWLEQGVSDTGIAVGLATVLQKITNTAEELSLAGCGSHKVIRVFVDADPFNQAKVEWNSTYVFGEFYMLDNTLKYMKAIPFPSYIRLVNNTLDGGYYEVTATKVCNDGIHPSSSGCVGYGC